MLDTVLLQKTLEITNGEFWVGICTLGTIIIGAIIRISIGFGDKADKKALDDKANQKDFDDHKRAYDRHCEQNRDEFRQVQATQVEYLGQMNELLRELTKNQAEVKSDVDWIIGFLDTDKKYYRPKSRGRKSNDN